METRTLEAYGLILFIALVVGGIVAFKLYHAQHRVYRRRQRKQDRAA